MLGSRGRSGRSRQRFTSRARIRLSLAGLAIGLQIAGCVGASAEEVQRRFREYLETANRCERDDECVLVSTSCPLGCFAAARADRKADVEKKARELVEEYERGGQACIYGCVAPGEIACREQRCLVLPSAR